jgi:hypothetical protein
MLSVVCSRHFVSYFVIIYGHARLYQQLFVAYTL